MGQQIGLIVGIFALIVFLVLGYVGEARKRGEGDLRVIKDAAKKKEKLENDISDNKRMSLRNKLKWLRGWASDKEV